MIRRPGPRRSGSRRHESRLLSTNVAARGSEGRIANVSAIVWVDAAGDALVARVEADLGRLFEEVLVVREELRPDGELEDPVARLERALACATADRALVVTTASTAASTAASTTTATSNTAGPGVVAWLALTIVSGRG